MKQYLFLATHLHSGYRPLVEFLNQNQQLEIADTGSIYTSALDLLHSINAKQHKLQNMSAIHADVLTYNFQLTNKSLYKESKFIFLIRRATPTLGDMLWEKIFPDEQSAFLYYSYRLRRLCEMAKAVPGAVVLTEKDLMEKRGDNFINEYLGLTNKIDFKDYEVVERKLGNISFALSKKAEECYEKHLFYLKSLNIKINR